MIPIGHDRQVTRTLPLVTIILIALNCAVFIVQAIVTPGQDRALDASLDQLIEYTARYPQVLPTEEARERLDRVPESYLRNLRAAITADLSKEPPDAVPLDAEGRITSETQRLVQLEMIRRSNSFIAAYDHNFNLQFGFIPASHSSSPLNYISNIFLHGSWEHLAGNMLCLFVVGMALEDTWGAVVYLIFYLAGGIFATFTHFYSAPSNRIVCLGASGAIASLMGAFLVRHFRTRIKLFLFVAVIRVPAYLYFPFMVALDIRNSFARHTEDAGGVALWAHIGGFTFGAILSALIYYSGVERLFIPANSQSLVSFGTGSALEEARRHLIEGDIAEATRKLRQRVDVVPADLNAWQELAHCYQLTDSLEQHRSALMRVMQLTSSQRDKEATLRAYSDYLDSYPGGEKPNPIPAQAWAMICHYLVEKEMYYEAAGEYEKLAREFPQHPSASDFLIEAAVCRERLADEAYARLLLRRARENKDFNPAKLLRLSPHLADLD